MLLFREQRVEAHPLVGGEQSIDVGDHLPVGRVHRLRGHALDDRDAGYDDAPSP